MNGIIFIDTNTGTWGSAEGLRFIPADPETVAYLEDASDSEIMNYALAHGEV